MAENAHGTAPVYDRHGVSVIHGPALEALSGMADASIDAVVCDPPYGLGNHSPAAVTTALTAWANGDRERVPDGRGFMGQEWDSFVPPPAVWDECLRVLKPGGHLACFAGSRTLDLMTLSVRMAGFEIRDTIAAWLYSSGFAKSLDVAKAIDKRGGTDGSWFADWLSEKRAESGTDRRVLAEAFRSKSGGVTGKLWNWENGHGVPTQSEFDRLCDLLEQPRRGVFEAQGEFVSARRGIHAGYGPGDLRPNQRTRRDVTAAATEAARRWEGWGTALAPSYEPIILARKPLSSTVAATVLEHGTGGLNIAATRTGTTASPSRTPPESTKQASSAMEGGFLARIQYDGSAGRWPKNAVFAHHPSDEPDACHPDCHVRALDEQTGTLTSGKMMPTRPAPSQRGTYGQDAAEGWTTMETYGDSGGASRFFPTFRYEAKAPQSERPQVRAKPMLRLRANLSDADQEYVFAELRKAGVDVY